MKIGYIGNHFDSMKSKFPILENCEIQEKFNVKDLPMLMIEGAQTSDNLFGNLDEYLKSGGRILLLGKAIKILEVMDIEYMVYSTYAVEEGNRLSGFKVKNMTHPVFAGFDSDEIVVSDVTAYIALEAITYMRPSGNILAGSTIINSTKTTMTEYEYESGRVITFPFDAPTPYNVDALYEENLMKIYQNIINYFCDNNLLAMDLQNQKIKQAEIEYVNSLHTSEIQPKVAFEKKEIEPYKNKKLPSQLLRRSVHYADAGLAKPKQKYEPIETGGFTIKNGLNYFNKPIVDGMNKLFTSDRPKFRTSMGTGTGSIDVDYRCFPVAGRSMKGSMYDHDLGTLSLGMVLNGRVIMFDDFDNIQVWFLPGITKYELSHKDSGKIYLTFTHAQSGYGLILSVTSEKEHEFYWNYGNIKFNHYESNTNTVEILPDNIFRIKEPNLPKIEMYLKCTADGQENIKDRYFGQEVNFTTKPTNELFLSSIWGFSDYDKEIANTMVNRVPDKKLQKLWWKDFIEKPSNPYDKIKAANPQKDLEKAIKVWEERTNEFQIKTPDPYLNALVNYTRATGKYCDIGCGTVVCSSFNDFYGHISNEIRGKDWAGDHEEVENHLKLKGLMQCRDGVRTPYPFGICGYRKEDYSKDTHGFIPWISLSLETCFRENDTPYYPGFLWNNYLFTHNKEMLAQMFETVDLACKWQLRFNQIDGECLFGDWYEYWDSDSGSHAYKLVTSTALTYNMFDSAAKMANVLGKDPSFYQEYADKIKKAFNEQLWDKDEQILCSRSVDYAKNPHPSLWDIFLSILSGILSAEQAEKCIVWARNHLVFEGEGDIRLMMNSDRWPLRWSVQYASNNDSMMFIMTALMNKVDGPWWEIIRSITNASFTGRTPGVMYSTSNYGVSGGEGECNDNTDAFIHCIVRGIFGIEPKEDCVEISPNLPQHWDYASIETRDFSVKCVKTADGGYILETKDKGILRSKSLNVYPVKKYAYGNERISVEVPYIKEVRDGKYMPYTKIQQLINQTLCNNIKIVDAASIEPKKIQMVNLAGHFTSTPESMTHEVYKYDHNHSTIPLCDWWFTTPLRQSAKRSSTIHVGKVPFKLSDEINDRICLSYWKPYPLNNLFSCKVSVKGRYIGFLMQNYAHGAKCYMNVAKIEITYSDGTKASVDLVSPYTMDVYYQHDAIGMNAIPYAKFDPVAWDTDWIWTGFTWEHCLPHADSLFVEIDSSKTVDKIELGVCGSEIVLGLLAISIIE